jgi:hypothetical protein
VATRSPADGSAAPLFSRLELNGHLNERSGRTTSMNTMRLGKSGESGRASGTARRPLQAIVMRLRAMANTSGQAARGASQSRSVKTQSYPDFSGRSAHS